MNTWPASFLLDKRESRLLGASGPLQDEERFTSCTPYHFPTLSHFCAHVHAAVEQAPAPGGDCQSASTLPGGAELFPCALGAGLPMVEGIIQPSLPASLLLPFFPSFLPSASVVQGRGGMKLLSLLPQGIHTGGRSDMQLT